MTEKWPPEDQLRQWWRDEEEFSRTELGHLFLHLKERCQRMEHERNHYRKIVMDWAAMQPDMKPIIEMLKPRQEVK